MRKNKIENKKRKIPAEKTREKIIKGQSFAKLLVRICVLVAPTVLNLHPSVRKANLFSCLLVIRNLCFFFTSFFLKKNYN